MRAAALGCLLLAACGAPIAGAAADAQTLSELGVFLDEGLSQPADGFITYTPAFPLWSDGLEKRRLIRLPAGESVDTSDPDHWRFPVGTLALKEFAKNGRRLETRFIERTGPGDDDLTFGVFVWRADGSDADRVLDGRSNVDGTGHDVPSASQCMLCHAGQPGRILGYSAIQLGRLPQGKKVSPPGDAQAQRALGYLHGNCGHCHSDHGLASNINDMRLMLKVADTELAHTGVMRTAVGRPVFHQVDALNARQRIAPGAPEDSAIIERLSRDDDYKMPLLGVSLTDHGSVQAVADWIRSLPANP